MTDLEPDRVAAGANDPTYAVYLLTLREGSDPFLERQRQALSSHLGQVEIVRGVSGRAMPTVDYYSTLTKSFAKYRRIISPSEIGCALSHSLIMEKFLSTGKSFALIFEDDVLFSETSFAVMRNGLSAMKPEDILVAGCQQGLEYLRPVIGNPVDGRDECFAVDPDCWHLVRRTCAYAAGRTAAEHVLSVQGGGLATADAFELLCPSAGRLLFCNAFSHPRSVDKSPLEEERSLMASPEIARPLMERLSIEVRKTMNARLRKIRKKYLIANGRLRVIEK